MSLPTRPSSTRRVVVWPAPQVLLPARYHWPSARPPAPGHRGVPVLAGTDVTGSIPQEVALPAQMGLEPKDALATASTWPRRFLGAPATADIVTYHHDPREDPGQLAHPAAVVAGRIRLR